MFAGCYGWNFVKGIHTYIPVRKVNNINDDDELALIGVFECCRLPYFLFLGKVIYVGVL